MPQRDEPTDSPDSKPARGGLLGILGRRTRSGRPIWIAAVVALAMFAMMYVLFRQNQGEQQALSSPESPAGLVLPDQGSGTPLAAVGRAKGLSQPCTAWLVAVAPVPTAGAATSPAADGPATAGPTSAAPTAASQGASAVLPFADRPAYAITTGKCVGITDSTTVIAGKQLSGATLGFNAFASVTANKASPLFEVPIKSIAWASARWLDLAVLQLGASYGDLAAQAVLPINPTAAPEPGTELLVAGVPVAGIPADQQFVRARRCKSGDGVEVLEYKWLWPTAVSSNCEGTLAGSAGSPAFNPAGDALAMVNTTTIDAPAVSDCGLGRPCEVTTGGVSVRGSTTYLQPVGMLSDCFVNGRFQLGGSCALEDPAGVVPAAAPVLSAQPGTVVPVKIKGKGDPSRKVADKQGLLAQTDCAAPTGWSRAVPEQAWRMRLVLPREQGWMLGCVGSPEQPTPVIVQSDATPPDPGDAELTVTDVTGGRRVAPVLVPPEYAGFMWTSGVPGKIDCATAEGFAEYTGEPAIIQADDLPATVCLIAIDEAGNQSAPVSREVK